MAESKSRPFARALGGFLALTAVVCLLCVCVLWGDNDAWLPLQHPPSLVRDPCHSSLLGIPKTGTVGELKSTRSNPEDLQQLPDMNVLTKRAKKKATPEARPKKLCRYHPRPRRTKGH